MLKRVIFDTVVFISIAMLPFWCTVLLALFGLLYFARWWEVVGFALLIELFYVHAMSPWFGILFPTTLAAVMLFALAEVLRAAIRESR